MSPVMEFLFHSVIEPQDGHTRYYNIYRIDETHILAECHHFNRERLCDGDIQLEKEGNHWKAVSPKQEEIAQKLAEEIERMEPDRSPA
jgi:hypothetical protein